MKERLKKGDRVRYLGGDSCTYFNQTKAKETPATVVKERSDRSVQVKFDKQVGGWGNRRQGIPDGCGQSIMREYLRKIKPQEKVGKAKVKGKKPKAKLCLVRRSPTKNTK